jgi:hypothetical protein
MAGGLDVPDLDLPVKGPKAAPAPARAAATSGADRAARSADAPSAAKVAVAAKVLPPMRPPAPSNNSFHSIDQEDGDLGGENLELDLGTEAAKKAAVAASAAAAAAAAPKPPPPLTEAQTSEREARALANYGEPPASLLKTPMYAYRVLRRRKQLKKLAEGKRKEAERADAAAEDALMAFAEIVRPTAERFGGSYDLAFEAVRAAERVLGERDAVLAAETDAHNQKKADIDARLTDQEAQLTQIQIEERQISGELAEAEALLRRAETRAKHADLEMKSAMAQAQGEADAANPPNSGKGPTP